MKRNSSLLLIFLQLQEALFKSYFTDGEYPDVERVTSLAGSVGLNEDDVKAYISNPSNQQNINQKATRWSGEGVNGEKKIAYFYRNNIPKFLIG